MGTYDHNNSNLQLFANNDFNKTQGNYFAFTQMNNNNAKL